MCREAHWQGLSLLNRPISLRAVLLYPAQIDSLSHFSC